MDEVLPDATPTPAPAPVEFTHEGANVKETLESILVAFILAFIFRCFVVEAFVIPTGSMAPTLLGAHSRFVCPDCGYHFDVNYSSPRQNEDDIDIPDRVQSVAEVDPDTRKTHLVPVVYDDIHCPNCGHRLPPEPNPPVWYGDRILVLKYMYLLQDPKRWDVVVFKSPSEREKDYSINFIKRLIGTPGETIMVLDGDIYVKRKGAEQFEIARKTPAAQQALWRILYDNDYHPDPSRAEERSAGDKPWTQPWRQTDGGAKWDTAAGHARAFAFDSGGVGTLTFDADANRPDNRAFGFADWLAYDQRHTSPSYMAMRNRDDSWHGEYPVSDLKLDLYYSRTSGDGPLKLKLTKLDHTFTAEIHPESIELVCEVGGKKAWQKTTHRYPVPAAAHVEFINVDYRVSVRVNGKELLATTDPEYHPNVPDLVHRQSDFTAVRGVSSDSPLSPPTVSISAERQSCQVSHVSLWRDVYYTQKLAGGARVLWASPEAIGGNGGPITLGDDEFFVMGDNSPMSYDARFWSKPVDLPAEGLHVEPGRVPERFMLGKAFFVYWPAGFKPTRGAPGIIPNFGQMRFIR